MASSSIAEQTARVQQQPSQEVRGVNVKSVRAAVSKSLLNTASLTSRVEIAASLTDTNSMPPKPKPGSPGRPLNIAIPEPPAAAGSPIRKATDAEASAASDFSTPPRASSRCGRARRCGARRTAA